MKCVRGKRNDTENKYVDAQRRLPVDHKDGEQDEHKQFPNIKKEREHDEGGEDKIDEHICRCKPELQRTREEQDENGKNRS